MIDFKNKIIFAFQKLKQKVLDYKTRVSSFWVRYKKYVFSGFASLVLVVTTLIGTRLVLQNQDIREKAATAGPALTFVPNNFQLTQGQSTTLSLSLATRGDTVSAVAVELSYNPSVIEVTKVSTKLPVLLSPVKIENGKISFTQGSDPKSPLTTYTVIAAITIKAINTTPTSIDFTAKTMTASFGKSTNSLIYSQGAKINSQATASTPETAQTWTSSPNSSPTGTHTDTPQPTWTAWPHLTPTSTPLMPPTNTPITNPTWTPWPHGTPISTQTFN